MTLCRSFAPIVLSATLSVAGIQPDAVAQGAPWQESAHPEPTRTKGWTGKMPPDLVRPASGKRSNVFYVGEPVVFKLGAAAASYEVRDYWGGMVDKGPASESVTVRARQPGWYKLYVYGRETRPEWGDIVGTTTFVIFRRNANFPALPSPAVPGGSYPSEDEPMRGVLGMGPQRHAANADKPDETIQKLDGDIALDRQYYAPFDHERHRPLMIAFPNGTKNLAGVRQIVEHFKGIVRYWEPRNEPNYGASAKDFVEKELKPFYETVKSVDPKLKVMGPGTVSIGPPLQPWLQQFFDAGGARYIDVFSFHAYNTVNGDLWLARKGLDTLTDLLARHGVRSIEKWQTEQGFFAAVYGSYQPRLQGRWTMLQMMVYEQYGIPKEHNHLWYDRSHGFWNFPTWWENDDGSLNPAAPLMRVWSEELFGTTFVRRLDFGEPGNKLYVGSLFAGSGRAVAAFMSAGSPDGRIALRVSRGKSLHVVSAFGVSADIPVRAGRAVLPVPELPVYVELWPNQSIQVVPTDWGPDLARQSGVTAAASIDAGTPGGEAAEANYPKLTNGELENWYWSQQKGTGPWQMGNNRFPGWVEVRLSSPARMARVVVYAAPPWQSQSTLVDYDLQYDDHGQWRTIERVQEPTKTFGVYSPPTRTTVDSFFSDRWVFQHSFAPVMTGKIRLYIRQATFGGGATRLVPEAGGQAGGQEVVLREIEIYGR